MCHPRTHFHQMLGREAALSAKAAPVSSEYAAGMQSAHALLPPAALVMA